MRNMNFVLVLSLALMGLSAPALSQPIIDGTADPEYGAALAVQNTQTGFGDSNLGMNDYANGSELDVAYGLVQGGILYLVLAGNLESNFNKLDIFIDSIAGQGQNRLRGDNPDVDFNGLNRMGDDGSGNGLTFDPGFEADFWLSVTGGGSPYKLYANYARLRVDGDPGEGYYLGNTGAVSDGTLSEGYNPFGIRVTINNSNTGGVTGGSGLDSGAGVTTGVEWAIPLAAIGNPSGAFKITAFINGVSHDYLSNQVLGGIGGGNNLGEPRNVNFANIAGDQFFVVPEPTSLGVLLLGLGALALRRRR